MKNKILLLLAIPFTNLVAAQCPKYCFIELFTSANCPPSFGQDHYLRDSILTPNPYNVHNISFHTTWGGSGSPIMYTNNIPGNDARFIYNSISAVSNFKLQGNKKGGLPSVLQQSDVDDIWSETSPIKVIVSETDFGTNRNVDVSVNTVGIPPLGTHRLFIALIEKNMLFTTPPGTNGDTLFSNVFLNMLNGNAGTHIDLAPTGSGYVHATINFNESLAILDTSELAVIAWVQDSLTKEVLQSGASFDNLVEVSLGNTATHVLNGPAASSHTFNLEATNTALSPSTYTFVFQKNTPGDWVANFEINGTTYTDTAIISLPADSIIPVLIHATPGITRSVGEFTLKAWPAIAGTAPITQHVYLISGITDMVVNNTSPQENITDLTAEGYEYVYSDGLIFAGNTGYGSTNQNVMARAIYDNAMTGVNNIWLNVSNTKPTFVNDNEVNQLASFLNAGGNLFISGQDIGYDLATTPVPAYSSFYQDYLHAIFVTDGSTANDSLTSTTPDTLFGPVPSSVLNNTHGTGFFFPDHISPYGTAEPIFNYDGNTSAIAGVRAQESTYKVVYLAVGVEMLSIAVRNEIIKLSHDWFYGILGTPEFEEALLGLSLGQNFPNPCTNSTTIAVPGSQNGYNFELVDYSGKVVKSGKIQPGSRFYEIQTNGLNEGTYLYRVADKKTGVSATKKLTVIH